MAGLSLSQVETDYCLLLALPCGRDQEDVVSQTESLKAAFITYLQAKQAAGIINVPNPGSNQVGLGFPFYRDGGVYRGLASLEQTAQ